MKVLAIDTGGDSCAVSLRIDGQLASEKIIETGRDQAKILAPLTAEVLSEHKLQVSDIDRFGIATGPGSFTGLRVGLAFVRGLALASGKKAYGFDHFSIIAHALTGHKHPTLIIRESKREDLFCAWMGSDGTLSDYFLSPAREIIETLPHDKAFSITGNGAVHLVTLKPELKNNLVIVADSDFMKSFTQLIEAATTAPSAPPQPMYLRDADVSTPKHIA